MIVCCVLALIREGGEKIPVRRMVGSPWFVFVEDSGTWRKLQVGGKDLPRKFMPN